MNLSILIGFVKASARLTFVSIFCIFTIPSSTTSWTKWYWTPMCLVLEWKMGFLPICKALWLLQNSEIFSCLCRSSFNNLLIQIASLQAYVVAMYSTFVVDRATTVWSFETQLTTPPVSEHIVCNRFSLIKIVRNLRLIQPMVITLKGGRGGE